MDNRDWVRNFIEAERLPPTYQSVADDFLIPFAKHFVQPIKQHRAEGAPMVIGVNGAQGTGKTTFAKFISAYLTDFHGLNGIQISLDDFYCTRGEREQRARDIHPLFLTRGVPGTHDTKLAISTLNGLKTLQSEETLALPSFDKASDDRKPKRDWPDAKGEQDFIIFEGWCVGSHPIPVSELKTPINELEENDDAQAIWRTAVNQFLGGDYQCLFSLIDVLIYLKTPDFETVLQWRTEQEIKLNQSAGPDKTNIMSPDAIANFIQHFERITRNDLRCLPPIVDYVFEFDRGHQIVARFDKQNYGNSLS
jgi:D-glycerate 3-kinase